jgi:acetylornithine deacetylase/succinyl-diaminopimelate desuccinylase-like protein
MRTTGNERERVFGAVQRERLLDTATRLIGTQSWTGAAKPALDCLADILRADGFEVERPAGGHAAAPAVLVRFAGKRPGKTLQFNGHLDTVHLPFVPPRVEGGLLRGSGSSDMKAGTAAAVEALRAVRDTDGLKAGAILFTANDLHEAPWGDGRQLNQLITEGLHGDAVLIPEYLNDVLPVIGRGALTWKIFIRRHGAAIHEVMRPKEPNVIAVGAELAQRLLMLDLELAHKRDAMAGPETLFIGQIHSGEIYNQYPHECLLEGTRRWLPGTRHADVEIQLRQVVEALAHETGTTIAIELCPIRDAFLLDRNHPFVGLFQETHQATTGKTLPLGAKPFCDDANSFWSIAGIPAITHGPKAGGAHTLEEWVSIDDLLRVARLYALTALEFCGE